MDLKGAKMDYRGAKVFATVFLTVLSVLAWSHAVMTSRLNIGDYGLIESLSPSFFIGLLLLTISFLLTVEWNTSRMLLYLQVLLLIIFLFLTPMILEGTPRFRSSYKVYGFIEYIIRNESINAIEIWYHNWPGVSIFFAILFRLINPVNGIAIQTYFPFIVEILYFFPVYVFLNAMTLNSRSIWVGVWVFYVLNYLNQDYLSPQSVSYLFFLVFILIVIRSTINLNDNKFSTERFEFKIILVIMFFSAVISHFLTSMLMLVILVTLNLLALFLTNKNIITIGSFSTRLIILCGIIFMAWVLYGASVFFEWHLGEFIGKMFNSDLFLNQNLEKRVAGSPSHVLISKIMVFMAISAAAISIMGIAISFLKRIDTYTSINMRMIAIIAAILIASPISSYGGEIMIRVFLFSLPLIAFFISQLYASKLKFIVIIFLILAMPFHILAHYGNEAYDYVSPGEFKSNDFFYEKLNASSVFGGPPVGTFRSQENYTIRNLADLNDFQCDINSAIVISRGDKVRYKHYSNDSLFISELENNLSKSDCYSKLYDDGDVQMYKMVRAS